MPSLEHRSGRESNHTEDNKTNQKKERGTETEGTSSATTEKSVGFESHGRPSRKHGFREASDERRSGTRRDCHCECCCTQAKADDGQNDTTAKHRPQT